MNTPDFEDLVIQLTGDHPPRVWTLLVSLFGELAQDKGAQISGTLLNRLMALMGIKPEAMRVALHRLRKDGWIKSERSGRTSTYALTDWGRAQSAEATPRIYDLDPVPQQAWLVLFDPGQPVSAENVSGAWITSNLLITNKLVDTPETFVTVLPDSTPLPDWMANKVCTPETAQLSQDLFTRLDRVQRSLKTTADLDPFKAAALRILIVDRWRRIVLRTPHLPNHVFPDAWAGQPCRAAVATLLTSYPKPALDDLEKAV